MLRVAVGIVRTVFVLMVVFHMFFFKQKTAYEMRISDWSSDVCSSDLILDSKPLLSRAFGRGDDLRRIANEPPTVSVIDTEQLGPGHRPLVVTEGVSSDDRERR